MIFLAGTDEKACPGRAHLVVEVERRRGETLVIGADQKRAHAPEQHRLGDRDRLGGAHALADQGEGLGAAAVRGGEIIGLVEIDVVDAGKLDERGDGERLVALRNDGRDFLRLDRNIFVLADLVALDLVVAFDRLAGLGVDETGGEPGCRSTG